MQTQLTFALYGEIRQSYYFLKVVRLIYATKPVEALAVESGMSESVWGERKDIYIRSVSY